MARSKRRLWKISIDNQEYRCVARSFGHAVRIASRMLGVQVKTDKSTGGWHGVSGEVID